MILAAQSITQSSKPEARVRDLSVTRESSQYSLRTGSGPSTYRRITSYSSIRSFGLHKYRRQCVLRDESNVLLKPGEEVANILTEDSISTTGEYLSFDLEYISTGLDLMVVSCRRSPHIP